MENSGTLSRTLEAFPSALPGNLLEPLQQQYSSGKTAYPVRLLSGVQAQYLLSSLQETVFLSRENILSVADPVREEELTRKVMGHPFIISVIEEITSSPSLALLNSGISIKPTCSARLSYWNATGTAPHSLPYYQAGYPIGVWIHLYSTEAAPAPAGEPRIKKRSTAFSQMGVRRKLHRGSTVSGSGVDPIDGTPNQQTQDTGLLKELARGELIAREFLSHEAIHAAQQQPRNEIVTVSLSAGEGIIFNCGEHFSDLNTYSVNPAWGVFGFYSPEASISEASTGGEKFH